MTQHNVGALVVVKPGEQEVIAGIITERGICSIFQNNMKPVGTFLRISATCKVNICNFGSRQLQSKLIISSIHL